MPLVRRVEHPRGDRRPRRAAQAPDRRGRWGRAGLARPRRRGRRGAPPAGGDRRARPGPRRRARRRVGRAARGRAGHRQVDAPAPGRGRRRGDGRRPVRDRRGVRGPGPAAGGAPRADHGRRGGADRGRRRDRRGPDRGARARARSPGSSSWTRCRPSRPTSSTGRRGASARSARRRCGSMELAKSDGVPVVLVGHVTKDGTLAGPKTLEHLVDVVLSVEGDRTGGLRLLRATKNRYGSTEEVGVFEMADRGPDRGRRPGPRVPRRPRRARRRAASSRRSSRARARCSSRCRRSSSPSGAPSPRRTASGIDHNRLSLLVAVLGRRAGIGLSGHDVYANLAGGLSVSEPGLDLPLALALASSLRDRPLRRRAPSRSARSGCWASCAPSAASTGGCARPRASGSRGPSSLARAAGPTTG